MSGGITVQDFKHIPGENDAEYIKLLEEHMEINKQIVNKAVAKMKELSAKQRTASLYWRKKGKWISLDDFRGKYNDYGYKCSECGEQSDYEENFCPNCGADMRGEEA